jgi:hypothetical protein
MRFHTNGFSGGTMKIRLLPILVCILAVLFLTSAGSAEPAASPLGTAFTYQGSLNRGGQTYTGTCDFQFSLWDAAAAGLAIGSTLNMNDLVVTKGRFTARLDFGTGAFNGDARWLGVAVMCAGDPGFTALGRQELTAVPYALYAASAPWSGLSGVPAGFADEVDDISLPGLFSITTLYRTESVGAYSSITTGADGLGLISFYSDTFDDLMVAHCNNITCSSATITRLDSDDSVGMYTSITIGLDGLGLISYYDGDNANLKVAHCIDLTCSSADITALDTTSVNVGLYSAITTGVDGFGLISYYDYINTNLKVAHCNDLACSSATITTIDSSGDVGTYTSIAIGLNGFGLISYRDAYNNGYLKVARCNNIDCSLAQPFFLDMTGNVGEYSSITIGADGLGLISYYDRGNGDLRVAHCSDVSCSSAAISIPITDGNVGQYSSITIGPDGLGLISYYDYTNDQLNVAHCSTVTCATATTTAVDSNGWAGEYTSITIGADGLPLVSYMDDYYYRLLVSHCSNPFCIPYFRR